MLARVRACVCVWVCICAYVHLSVRAKGDKLQWKTVHVAASQSFKWIGRWKVKGTNPEIAICLKRRVSTRGGWVGWGWVEADHGPPVRRDEREGRDFPADEC